MDAPIYHGQGRQKEEIKSERKRVKSFDLTNKICQKVKIKDVTPFAPFRVAIIWVISHLFFL